MVHRIGVLKDRTNSIQTLGLNNGNMKNATLSSLFEPLG